MAEFSGRFRPKRAVDFLKRGIAPRHVAMAALLAIIAVGSVYYYRAELVAAKAFALVRPRYEDVKIGDAIARIYVPASYVEGSIGTRANLYLHGNAHGHATFIGVDALRLVRDGDEILAIIDGQDYVSEPFGSAASGWGNAIYRQRYMDLYNFLRARYQIAEEVDLIGASMGGLAMGRFIVSPPFPVERAFGLGPVPFLQAIFDNGGDKRKAPIRNAFGMRQTGEDDILLSKIARDDFWTDDLPSMAGKLPPLKIVAGTGDKVFSDEFGGSEAYRRLCAVYQTNGGSCSYQEVHGLMHDHYAMLPAILDEALKPRPD